MERPITINQLHTICMRAILNGFGEREIHIPADIEGNAYHGLYFGFLTDEKELEMIVNLGLMDDPADPKKIVILG